MVFVFEKTSANAENPKASTPWEKAPAPKVKRSITFPWSKKTAGKTKAASQKKSKKVAYVTPKSILSPEGSDSDDSSKVPNYTWIKHQAQDSDSDDDEPSAASSTRQPKVLSLPVEYPPVEYPPVESPPVESPPVEPLPVESAKDQAEENDSSKESSLEDEPKVASLPDLKISSVLLPKVASLPEQEKCSDSSDEVQAKLAPLPDLETPSVPKPDVASLPEEQQQQQQPSVASPQMASMERDAEKKSDSEDIESKVASLPAHLLTPPDLSKPTVAPAVEIPSLEENITPEAEAEGLRTLDPYDGPQLQQDMKQLQQDMKQLQEDVKLAENDSDTAQSTAFVSDNGAPEDGWNSDSSSSSDGVKTTGAIPWGFKRDPLKPPRPLLTAKQRKKRRKEKEKVRAAKEPPPPLPEATKEEDAAASFAILQSVVKFTSRRGKEGVSTEHVKSEATSSYEELNGSWILPVKNDMDDLWGNPARPIEHKPGDQPSTQSGDDTAKDNSAISQTAPDDETCDVSFADDEVSISIYGITDSVQDMLDDDKPTPELLVSPKNIPSPAAAPETTQAPSAAREMMSPPDYSQRGDPTPVNTPAPSHSATPVPSSVLADSFASQDSWVPRCDPKKNAEKQEMPPDLTLQLFEAHKLAWDTVVPPEKENVTVDSSLGKEGTWLPPRCGGLAESRQRQMEEETKQMEEETKQSAPEIADVVQSIRAIIDVPSPPEKAPPLSKQAVSTSKSRGSLPAPASTRKIPVQPRPGLLPAFPSNINIAKLLPAHPSNRKIPVQARAVRVDFTGNVNQEQKAPHAGSRVPSVAAMQKEAKVQTSETAATGQKTSMESSLNLSLVSIDSTVMQEPPRILPGGRHGLPRKPSLAAAVLDLIILPGDRHGLPRQPSLAGVALDLIDDVPLDQLEEQRSALKPDAGESASQKQECKPHSKSETSESASQIASGGPAAISGQNQMARRASLKPSPSILKMLVIGTLILVAGAIAGVLVHFLK